MNRWSDGSVKHALISFNSPVTAGGNLVVAFSNSTNSSSGGSPLTQISDVIDIPYSATVSGFIWNWAPVDAATGSRHNGSVALSGTSVTSKTTTSSQLIPGAAGITVGLYDLTVQVQYQGKISAPSAPARIVITSGNAVKVYPNPWRKDKHAGLDIIFDNLPANTTVKIFTTSGHLVKELTGSIRIPWNRTTERGDPAASGIYLYSITTPSGQKMRGSSSSSARRYTFLRP